MHLILHNDDRLQREVHPRAAAGNLGAHHLRAQTGANTSETAEVLAQPCGRIARLPDEKMSDEVKSMLGFG